MKNIYSKGLGTRVKAPSFKNQYELFMATVPVFKRSLGFITLLVLGIHLPLGFLNYLLMEPAGGQKLIFALIQGFTYILYIPIKHAALYLGIFLVLKNRRPPTFSEAMGFARSVWFRFFSSEISAMGLVALGTLALIIPGVYAAVLFTLYGEVVCFEGIKQRHPLKRSAELTEGNRLFLFAMGFLWLIPTFVVTVSVIAPVIFLFKEVLHIPLLDKLVEQSCIGMLTAFSSVAYVLVYLQAVKRLKTRSSKKPKSGSVWHWSP